MLFETSALKDLVSLLSLGFSAPKSAEAHKTNHVLAVKVNGHTGVVLSHSSISNEEIEETLDFLEETQLGYWWIDSVQTQLASRLERIGCRYHMDVHLMKADLKALSPASLSEQIAIKRVSNLFDKELVLEVISTCFGVSKEAKQQWIDYLEANLGSENFNLYLAYCQGEAAAACLALEQDGFLILDEVCVLPAFRQQGLGFAVSYHALKQGQRKRIAAAILGATEAGGSLYKKLGFRAEGLYRVYDLPGKKAEEGVI